jgi:parvulin-like peptidyl-prolyl isomerase
MIRMIREKLAVVLWLVIAAFIATIVFEWGMGGFKGSSDIRSQGYIAKINGEEVKYSELKNIEDNYIKSIPQNESTSVKVAEMRQKAWNDFVRMIVIRQELERQNITVSPEHIYSEIINNPLPELRSNEQFMTDGRFDQAKYEEFIKNPRPELEQFYRSLEEAYAGRIPGMILETRVANSAYVSEFDLINKYMDQNLKAKVKYLRAPANEFMPSDSLITNEEIAAYYNENKHEFPLMNEERNFDYVLFSTQPTEKDSAMVLDDINYALQRINSGIAFEEVARNYSEDNSAQNGGDLGYFERGKMVPEFEEAAFGADIGEVVGPVKSNFGYHIIKVTDQKRENGELKEVKASHILMKFKAHQETFEDAQYAAVNFRDEIYRLGNDDKAFKQAAENLGLNVNEAPFTAKTDRTNELGIVPGMGDFLFNNEAGTISSIMVSNAGYIMMKIKDMRPERERTLDEVKKSIIFKIRQQKGLEAAYAKITEIAGSVKDTLSMNQTAEREEKLKTGVTTKIGPDTHIENVGAERTLYETAMSLNKGNISEPFRGAYGAYMIYLIEKDEFDQKKYEEEKKAFREREEMLLQREVVQKWLDGLVENADLVDYRGLYR